MKPKPHQVMKRRSDRRNVVTVCIAAVCHTLGLGDFIVTAVDSAVTYGNVTADTFASKSFMTKNWVVMKSGELGSLDVIGVDFTKLIKNRSDDFSEVRMMLRKVYKNYFAEWATDRCLNPYNIEMDEFINRGRRLFGDREFERINRIIETEASQFDGALLLAGWGRDKRVPCIFSADRDGVRAHHSTGFYAIGSGGPIAINSFLLHAYTKSCPLQMAIYFVAAAKFAAEADSYVGKNTYIWVEYPGEIKDGKAPGFILQPDQVTLLRTLWEEHGKPKEPDIAGDSDIARLLVPEDLSGRIRR